MRALGIDFFDSHDFNDSGVCLPIDTSTGNRPQVFMPSNIVHYSVHGSAYSSPEFTALGVNAGVRNSLGLAA
jgi:hypothetical protein